MNKEKYQKLVKKVGQKMLTNLEPVVKSSLNDLLDAGKEIIEDSVTNFFNKTKSEKKERKHESRK